MRRLIGTIVLLMTACRGQEGSQQPATAPRTGEAPLVLDIEADAPAFDAAAQEYRALWQRDGARIVAAMQRHAGLEFEEQRVVAYVRGEASQSGFRDAPMILRASYPEPTKRGTLIHELGHRLQGRLFRPDEDNHRALFLWLYAVWEDLYGSEFAAQQVKVESERHGRYDYASAWNQVLALEPGSRALQWRALRDERLQQSPR